MSLLFVFSLRPNLGWESASVGHYQFDSTFSISVCGSSFQVKVTCVLRFVFGRHHEGSFEPI